MPILSPESIETMVYGDSYSRESTSARSSTSDICCIGEIKRERKRAFVFTRKGVIIDDEE